MKKIIIIIFSVSVLILLLFKNVNNFNKYKNREIKKINDSCICDGVVFKLYPTFDKVKDKNFKKILSKLPKINNINNIESISNFQSNLIMNDFTQIICNDFKIISNMIEYKNCKQTIDNEWSIIWNPIGILPSNGNFISLLIESVIEGEADFWYDYYLTTYDLNGKPISIIYLFGHDEFNYTLTNKDSLYMTEGKSFCLNTNKPIIRRAISWKNKVMRNWYDKKKNLSYMTQVLEIVEKKFEINENGKINLLNKTNIIPKKQIYWTTPTEDFSLTSDTIRNFLKCIN